MYFAQLFTRYQALLLEFGDSEMNVDDFQDYRPEILQKKLLRRFGDHIMIKTSVGSRFQKIIFQSNIDVSLIASNITLLETKNETFEMKHLKMLHTI